MAAAQAPGPRLVTESAPVIVEARPAGKRTIAIAIGVAILAIAVVAGKGVPVAAAGLALIAVAAALRTAVVGWTALLSLLLAVILFVPIGRYSLPINLPFGVELYRIAVGVVLICWVSALLVDPRIRLRRSPMDWPLAVIVGATIASILTNAGRVASLDSAVLKSVTFLLSFVLVYYLIVSVVTSEHSVVVVTKMLVCGVMTVSAFAVFEQRTSYNVFDHVSVVLPFLQFDGGALVERDGLVRAIASAGHPIALGVLFAMTLPIALSLAFASGRRWWIPASVILLGVMSTVSRTPVIVLLVGMAVLAWLRPKDLKSLLPLLIPAVIVIKLMLPGSLVTVKNAFFPPGGIIQEQELQAPEGDPLLVGGRVRQLGPSLREASRTPIFGQGFGTRQTGIDNPLRNAPILDNQWLGLLLEVGLVGVIGWFGLIAVAVRRLGRRAKDRAGPAGWIAAGLAAAIAGFGAGMVTYDSLGFVQEAFVFWIVVALGAALLLATRTSAR